MRTDDPLEVLRATEQTGDLVLTRETAASLRERETAAVTTAALTPGIQDVLTAAKDTGRLVVVVSNNSDAAVGKFLELHDLTSRLPPSPMPEQTRSSLRCRTLRPR